MCQRRCSFGRQPKACRSCAGELAALWRWPLLLLGPTDRARTSYFERRARDDPAELESGLVRLADDLRHGRRPDVEVEPLRSQVGDGAVLAWRQPLTSRTV